MDDFEEKVKEKLEKSKNKVEKQTPVWRQLMGVFFFAIIGLSLPVTLLLTRNSQDIRQRAAGSDLQPTLYFSQPSIDASQVNTTIIGEVNPENNKFLIRTSGGPNSASNIVTWDVGKYTGFTPSGNLGDYQRGPNNITDGTAVQIQGTTGGVWINSQQTANTASLITATPAYWWWNPTPHYKPFETSGSEVGFSFDMKVPTALRGGEGQAYVVAYFLFKDQNNPNNQFWYGAQVFDLRGPVPETILKDDWENGTGLPIVLSILNDGSKWVSKAPSSKAFQKKTWSDFKYFEFRINDSQFKSVLTELKKNNSSVSDNPADYYIDHINFNPEIYQANGGANNWAQLGMAFKNMQIVGYKPTGDTTAPTVSITKPSNGSKVSRDKTTTIEATASDESGISKVEFYINDVLICSDSKASYKCSWKVPKPKGVTYNLVSRAYDTKGNVGTSQTVVVTSK